MQDTTSEALSRSKLIAKVTNADVDTHLVRQSDKELVRTMTCRDSRSRGRWGRSSWCRCCSCGCGHGDDLVTAPAAQDTLKEREERRNEYQPESTKHLLFAGNQTSSRSPLHRGRNCVTFAVLTQHTLEMRFLVNKKGEAWTVRRWFSRWCRSWSYSRHQFCRVSINLQPQSAYEQETRVNNKEVDTPAQVISMLRGHHSSCNSA